MTILVLNCGSSSIKYQLVEMISANENTLLAKGLVDRIGQAEGDLKHKPEGKDSYSIHTPIENHTKGINLVLEALTNPEHGVISSLDVIGAVGHRVAHGGEYFADSCLVDAKAKEQIRELISLAPLHNPANLQGIESVEELMPSTPQVAVFDTSFHQTLPAENFMYAIPRKYYEKYGIRKYGFHGTSHKYVAQIGAEMAGLDFENSKIVTCHVGNGGSVTAVLNGKSIDTSMGFSPLDGLIMGTRCGSIDASIVTFIGEKENLSYAEINSILNKESGVLGMTDGFSSDMRDIDNAYHNGDKLAIVARDAYYLRIKKFIGEYAADMGGLDMIIFTGGCGENSDELRESVASNLEFMGVEFDSEANKGVRGTSKILSKADSRVKVAVIETNEEKVIAMDTYRLCK